jgi:pimeloyl-ACP methyl ester carboxylesterase
MIKLFSRLAIVGSMILTAAALGQPALPTIVLVHGAFADASSWNGVVRVLETDGYPVVAVANPMRSVKTDARYVRELLTELRTPVVLVGHSYGGLVISEAAKNDRSVKALVYVSAFAAEAGETAAGLSAKYPGSTLGPALAAPVPLAGGDKDLYVRQDAFPGQFAADIPLADAKLMAATQRPITVAALHEPSTDPAWKDVPSWFIYGDQDMNIPAQALEFMAVRAHSRQTIVVKGASHVVMVSNPEIVAHLIERAATQN